MPEGTGTTFEEAKKCFKCGNPGEETSQTRAPNGVKGILHFITCRTPFCPWEDTNWVVQVNDDGSIPTRNTSKRQDKMYPELPMTAGQRALDNLQKQVEAETQGQAEIYRPTGF